MPPSTPFPPSSSSSPSSSFSASSSSSSRPSPPCSSSSRLSPGDKLLCVPGRDIFLRRCRYVEVDDRDFQLDYLRHFLRCLHGLFFSFARRCLPTPGVRGDGLGAASAPNTGDSRQTKGVPMPKSSPKREPTEEKVSWANMQLSDAQLDRLPDVFFFLQRIRSNVLKGVRLSTSGIRNSFLPSFRLSDVAHWAHLCGAQIEERPHPELTHLICMGVTQRWREAQDNADLVTPHFMWLEKTIYTLKRPEEKNFDASMCERRRSVWHCFNDNLEDYSQSTSSSRTSGGGRPRAVGRRWVV
eukprot:GHVT01090008.1.p1 GENE.GHVT01090008.1~~GHVT01090008.1.p1  ORF type:complete len:298 (+),score=68.36 GHVT01090008.1:257-1150(+)